MFDVDSLTAGYVPQNTELSPSQFRFSHDDPSSKLYLSHGKFQFPVTYNLFPLFILFRVVYCLKLSLLKDYELMYG